MILTRSGQEMSCSVRTRDSPAAVALANPSERVEGVSAPSLSTMAERGEQVDSLLHFLAQRDHPYLSHAQMTDLCSKC